MTVSNTLAGVVRTGDGLVTDFSFSFQAGDASHIKVSLIENALALTPVSPSAYSATLNPGGVGGEVVFLAAPANGQMFYIYRDTPRTQLVGVSSQQKYDPEVVGAVWDRLTFMIQELTAEVARALLTAPGEDPAELLATISAARDAAVAAATLAQAWAANPENDDVTTGLFSALHYAAKAAASAAAAATFDPALYLTLAGAQTVTGAKTFSDLVVVQRLKVLGRINLSAVDVQTATEGGQYYIQPGCTNSPDTAQGWFLDVGSLSGTDLVQIAYRHAVDTGQVAIKTRVGGTWSDWHFFGGREGTSAQSFPAAAQADFTAIPVYATEVGIHVAGVSSTAVGAALFSLQLRAASVGAVATGYYGSTATITASAIAAGFASTTKVDIAGLLNNADAFTGDIRMRRVSATNRWNIGVDGRRGDALFRGFATVDLGANPIAGVRFLLDTGNFDNSATYTVDWWA